MKKTQKIIATIVLILMLVVVSTSVFATTFGPANVKANTSNTEAIQNIGGRIVGILQVVGSIAAVAILIVLGIKYMMGSAEEKADYKKTMIPYIIGAIFIFAASNIAGAIYNWSNTIA